MERKLTKRLITRGLKEDPRDIQKYLDRLRNTGEGEIVEIIENVANSFDIYLSPLGRLNY